MTRLQSIALILAAGWVVGYALARLCFRVYGDSASAKLAMREHHRLAAQAPGFFSGCFGVLAYGVCWLCGLGLAGIVVRAMYVGLGAR